MFLELEYAEPFGPEPVAERVEVSSELVVALRKLLREPYIVDAGGLNRIDRLEMFGPVVTALVEEAEREWA